MDIHPFYKGTRIYFFASYVPIFAAFTLQLYWDRRELRDRAQLKKVSRISRISGWISCIFVMIANVDFYSVFGIYPSLFTSIVYSLSVWFSYLPLVLAGYHATLAAAAFFSHSKRQLYTRITKTLFFNAGPVVMTSLFVATVSHLTASGLFNCISGLLAYPTLAVGVNVMYFLLSSHHKKLSAIKSGPSKNSRSLASIVHKWRSYAIYVSLTMAIVTAAYILRFRVTLRQVMAGTVMSTAADATVVRDASEIPGFGGLVLPIAVQLTILCLLWRSWRTKDQTHSERKRSGTGPSSDKFQSPGNTNRTTNSNTASGGGYRVQMSHQTHNGTTDTSIGTTRKSASSPTAPTSTASLCTSPVSTSSATSCATIV